MGNGGGHALGRLDELDASSVRDDVLIDVADARVGNAALHNHRSITERETEIVQRIQLKGETGLDLHPAMTHLADCRRLKHHYLAVQRSQELDALGIPLVRGHSLEIIA